MVAKGVRAKICGALAKLDLKRDLKKFRKPDFSSQLDRWTEQVSKDAGAPWGPTRKAVNLFLRDVSYNIWLRDSCGIATHEAALEVPLDGLVMEELRKLTTERLPRSSVKALTSEQSGLYQAVAAKVAAKKGIHRVHLDLDWWAGRERSA